MKNGIHKKLNSTDLPDNEDRYYNDGRGKSPNIDRRETLVCNSVGVSMVTSHSLLLSIHVGNVISDHKQNVSGRRKLWGTSVYMSS